MVKSNAARAGRKKKIKIKRIKKTDARDVCFSKRRQGLFNKAGEISLLCNADVAVVTLSRDGKGFSYGHPSVGAIADRLADMAIVAPSNPSSLGGGDTHDSSDTMQQMKLQFVEMQNSMESMENKRTTVLEKIENEKVDLMHLLNTQPNVLGIEESKELYDKLSALQSTVRAQIRQKLSDAGVTSSTMPLPDQPPVEMAAGSSQFHFEGQGVTPANTHLPAEISYGLTTDEIFGANDLLIPGVQDGGGFGDCPSSQFGW
ncbi:agamous-like MADS-box protein AGL29 [Oryza brachyantha]|uniref:MADS-box domain-containing protein n=1 Tax=Oryza brachyantha TaxID=4533 RepID=J3MDK6_ORYBR|nr:agamous-like MADS-box protein AGL29 [Oryza brachyantha]